ncbi:MAG: M3 family metallopeptidase, partial [Betaproteobacteria bacterium]|nr:M3 family metallopeptidase [Betaproteobacteria bacterium]
MENPLVDLSGLPRFAAVRPEHVEPAIDSLMAEGRAAIERLAGAAQEPTWEGFVEPLESANERLARAWSLVTHLNAVVNAPALREAYTAALPRVTQFFTEQGQDLRLYGRYKALAASPAFAKLGAARRRLVDNELRDFRLGGAELPEAGKARFKQLQEELAAISARFQDNVLDATNDFGLVVTDPAWLQGIPADVLEVARAAASREGREGWKLTLHMPCYLPVMQYADHRPLREQMYRAYVTRASEFGKPEWDNGPLIATILEKRAEVASLLGFGTFAGVSLATKMAGSPAEVVAFLEDLAARAKPFAERDMAELAQFARAELDLADVRAWDVAWASEKLRQKRYAFSDNEVKAYFPEDAVLGGLFRVIETLYGVRVKQAAAETWHPDVK